MSQAGSLSTGGGGNGGIITINGDSGSITGTSVKIFTDNAFQNCGSSVSFVNSGTTSTLNVTTFFTNNIFFGKQAGNATQTGVSNATFGFNTGHALTTGAQNSIFGASSGRAITTGSSNTLIGQFSGGALVSGSNNLILGADASGFSYTSSESSNILLMNIGVAGESNVTRIGTDGSGSGQVNQCFVAGIAGVTVANSAAVLIDTTSGQLGTIASSIRFKENVQDMGTASDFIYNLRPVKFTLKSHPEYGQQTGLIAEEVIELAPHLVPLDKEGKPATVCYHELPTLLLNEIQKLNKRIMALEKQLGSTK